MARTRTPHEVDSEKIKENASTPEIRRFAETFNSILTEKKIHQGDLANALGISTGIVSAYRNGKKEPKLSMILKIADYLNVDCDYLLRGVSSTHLDIYKTTALSEAAINTFKHASGDSRQRWGEVLNEFVTRPWIIDILHKYLFWNIDKIGKWREDIRATGAYAIIPGEYDDLVPLVDSEAGMYTAVEASMLGDALLLAVEGELRELKSKLGERGHNGQHKKGT